MATKRAETGNQRRRSAAADARRARALELFLAGKTTAKVAEELGVHESTVSTWRSEPEMAAALKRAEEDAVQHASTVMRRNIVRVVESQVRIALGETTPIPGQMEAADRVMNRVLGKPGEKLDLTTAGGPLPATTPIDEAKVAAAVVALQRQLRGGEGDG